MNLAIMQPYLFPYLGYFQLVHAVDEFVFYDDATFRKQSWIHRNRILVGDSPHLFSVPLSGASSSVPINRTMVDQRQWQHWRGKFMRTLAQTYASSKTRQKVLDLVAATLEPPQPDIATLAARSVRLCCDYLDLSTRFSESSQSYPPSGGAGCDRVIEICRSAGATTYLNAPGGRGLYDVATFEHEGIELRFLAPCLEPYPQPGTVFVPGLSILDVLMRQDRTAARAAARRGASG